MSAARSRTACWRWRFLCPWPYPAPLNLLHGTLTTTLPSGGWGRGEQQDRSLLVFPFSVVSVIIRIHGRQNSALLLIGGDGPSETLQSWPGLAKHIT